MITDENREKRFRYRLSLHGLHLHKEKNERGDPVYYLTGDDFPDRPDDDDPTRWLTFYEVERYCEELEEQDAEQREENTHV